MTTNPQFDRIVALIGEFLELDTSHLKIDSSLATAVPGLDSLKLFEMMLYLEDRLQISFDEKAVQKLDTIGDLVNYVADRQGTSTTVARSAVEGQP